jgi:hypothetical protein
MPGKLAPGNHTLTATYNGDALFTPSSAMQNLAVPQMPTLTTRLVRKHGRFLLQVLDDGQPLKQFTLNSKPVIQMRDLNGTGIADLVINVKKGKNLVVVAAFSGADAAQIA